ncbi:MAG: cob(I)yrinic acid a,c-diamide adenosyltransferase [Clostridia bacterium]
MDESPRRHMHRIYTRRGDAGATATRGRERVRKDDPRVASYGTLYELNAHVGLALAALRAAAPAAAGPEWALLEAGLEQIQHRLFHVGRDLSRSRGVPGREDASTLPAHVTRLEALFDVLAAKTPPWKPFTLPGGAVTAAQLFVATTVCRRAEREIVALTRASPVPESVLAWVNRLSDLLFVAGRYVNGVSGFEEPQLADPVDGF